ncbi:neither inactivation nor afterpotential protein G [Ischnura elegans]|uniref:neither inactivation nor afterpotential protein G n=1 Tax=Ischnura elegans TaxID=197161 RepID=UPI001ED8915C|nr:neither inactivation nor afterpotential protein G [Ischnura elegans]
MAASRTRSSSARSRRRRSAEPGDGSRTSREATPALAADGRQRKRREKVSHVKVISVYGMMVAGMLLVMTGLGVYCAFFTTRAAIIGKPNSTYDYIVVGAGTAGCVIAGRLTTANRNSSVLLVEAGGDFGWMASVPFASPLLQGSPKNDWNYRTVPQKTSSWGLRDRVSMWPRGKGLGGTGQLNYMLHSLGHWEDFEHWKKDLGVTGWDASTLQPYMRRMLSTKNFEVEDSCNPDESTGGDGSCEGDLYRSHLELTPTSSLPGVVVEVVNPKKSPIAKAFLDAGKELNIESEKVGALDYGFLPAMSTIAHGQRWSSYHGYLKPVLDEPNVHVLLNTHVSKVIFSNPGNSVPTAIGVQLAVKNERNESKHEIVYAKQEIILCAGAINSAQILLLSGIGPREHLEELEIPVVADLPVGNNLFDHLNMPVYVSLESPVSVTKEKVMTLRTVWDYMIYNKGILSSSGVQGVGKVDPHSGLILFGMGSTDDALRDVANYRPDAFNAIFPLGHNISQEGMIILSACLQPRSRGTVRLKDTSPFSDALIDPQYLSRREDINCTATAVRLAVKVAESKAFRKLGAKVHLPKPSQCGNLSVNVMDDEYMECIIRTGAITGYHPGGTCKMGHPDDPTTVVDSNLRVKKVRRLRVMDASILPTSISGTPNSVLIAMSERAANLITWSNII